MIVIDAGHGGLNSHGDYTTWPDKMAIFDSNPCQENESTLIHKIGEKFYFFEGEFNRIVANKTSEYLVKLGIPHITTYSDVADTPLRSRVLMERNLCSVYGSSNVLTISIHANASPKGKNQGKARGLEVFTSVGETNSDVVASYFLGVIQPMLSMSEINLPIRMDYFSDSDPDKESNFYILRNTYGSAILIECGFMDNIDDVNLLCNPDIQDLYAKAAAMTAAWFHNQDKSVEFLGTAISNDTILPPRVGQDKKEP